MIPTALKKYLSISQKREIYGRFIADWNLSKPVGFPSKLGRKMTYGVDQTAEQRFLLASVYLTQSKQKNSHYDDGKHLWIDNKDLFGLPTGTRILESLWIASQMLKT